LTVCANVLQDLCLSGGHWVVSLCQVLLHLPFFFLMIHLP
jgi:hypothetical protein